MSGRGEYYRNKYGGGRGRGGRGGGGPGGGGGRRDNNRYNVYAPGGGTTDELHQLLQSIDGKQYPSYHDLETTKGKSWILDNKNPCTLEIGRTQADPFAPPTRCRVQYSASPSTVLPSWCVANPIRRLGAADYIWRQVYAKCQALGTEKSMGGGGWSGPKGGDLRVLAPTQHVVESSAVSVDSKSVITLQISINLPARGRTVLGHAAWSIFNETLLQGLVQNCLGRLDAGALRKHVESIEDQAWLQTQLQNYGLLAFVRNGAMLPRASGVDDRPMTDGVPFQSPPSLERSFTLPNSQTEIKGMAIQAGTITLICGGGFHGKSTLLEALQASVYLKVPGDGREFCVVRPTAVKIRSEDGRAVCDVDISPFISNLPGKKDTTRFSTPNASGSTSQASNIVEVSGLFGKVVLASAFSCWRALTILHHSYQAIEMGADTLLVDEDTCATNFMIRDQKMMELVACEKEPITPFIRVVSSLRSQNVSTILVVGGTGDYFSVADHVLVTDCYRLEDATERAKAISSQYSSTKMDSESRYIPPTRQRFPITKALHPGGKVKVLARNVISFGDTEIDLGAQDQIIDDGQNQAIVCALQLLAEQGGSLSLLDALQALEHRLNDDGLDQVLAPGQFHGGLVRPRIFEVSAAINRLRRACVEQR